MDTKSGIIDMYILLNRLIEKSQYDGVCSWVCLCYEMTPKAAMTSISSLRLMVTKQQLKHNTVNTQRET
jgi:hypothetical protein